MRISIHSLAGPVLTIALSVPIHGVCTVTAAAHSAATAGLGARAPDPQTRADLEKVMRGEAFANVSYRLYAEQARREGMPSAARIFERAADAELNEHFTEAASLSGIVGDEAANLRAAMSGENYESTSMYPRFAREAKGDGDANAAERFSEIARDESKHRDAFGAALRVVQTRKGAVPAAPNVHAVRVPAGPAQVRAQRTKANLDAAMHGEAEAYAKYTLWGTQAAKRGNSGVADLFRRNGAVERQEHFAEEAQLAGLVGTTRENLTKAIAGEKYESTTMYPALAKRAKSAGNTKAARMFSHTATDEAEHARRFQHARDRLR